MAKDNKTYRILISAADPSADMHCAGLITALKQSGKTIEFVGMGGPKMAAAGCELLESVVSRAVMLYNAYAHVVYFYKLIKRITNYLQTKKVDLVIVCDSPAFNFHIAKAAKKAGIKTLFYVAPQLWAWAGWRIDKLRKCCDKLCCILPFEQEWFGQKGIDTTFVGNPLFDELEIDSADRKERYADFDVKNVKIALMPGSRNAEIRSLWRPMQQIAVRLKRKYPAATFTAVAADEEKKEMLKASRILGFRCEYTVGSVVDTAADSDFSLVASGSATLQVAATGSPMVVMYKANRILCILVGSWLVRPKYYSLVNVLADKEMVPEFMPYFTSIEPIIDSIEQLLEDKQRLIQTNSELIELTAPLRGSKTAQKVADIAIEMMA